MKQSCSVSLKLNSVNEESIKSFLNASALNQNLSIKDTELKRKKCLPHAQILSTCYISRLMVTIGFKSVDILFPWLLNHLLPASSGFL